MNSGNVNNYQLRSNPSHLYMHSNHYHHHNCYHYYDELELAAARACSSILSCGNTFEYFTNKSSIVYTWLSQLLEHANAEMKMYDVCKCALPNEIYMLSMHVCVQLLDLSLSHIVQSSSATNNNLINFNTNQSPLFDWILHKCFSAISQECADLCFIALAKVYVEYLGTNSNGKPTKNSFDHMYLGSILTLAMLNIGSSRLNIHETSITLLRAVNRAFLQENYKNTFVDENNLKQNKSEPIADANLTEIKVFWQVESTENFG